MVAVAEEEEWGTGGMAAELGQQTVEFSALVRRATEDSFLALKELVERSKAPEEQSDSEKKIELLKYIVKTRQRMLRLHVLAKWCQQVSAFSFCCFLFEIWVGDDESGFLGFIWKGLFLLL